MIFTRRIWIPGTWIPAALVLLALGSAAQAQSSRPITIVVSLAPGGGVDTLARLIAEKLPERIKQPVVVENRPGAGGMVGNDYVAKAAPDGHTLLLMENASVLHKWLNKGIPFDVITDFVPIALVATTPLLMFAHPSVTAADVKQVIAQAKANPGKLSVGTPGVGTPHHLAAAMMNVTAQVDITHVPYRGTLPSLNDLVGGQIPLIWATPVAVLPFVEAGKVKPLGVASQKRVAMFPQVPTIAENALPDFHIDIWFGLGAPARTPPEVIARLAKEIRAITELPDVIERTQKLGFNLNFLDSEAFGKLIRADHERFGKVIRDAGIAPH